MSKSINDELADYLKDKFLQLSDLDKEKLCDLYAKVRKTDIIYLWWFLSFHYLYVRKWWLFVVFLLSFGGIGFWWFIDLFRLPTILREYNNNKAYEVLKNLEQNNAT